MNEQKSITIETPTVEDIARYIYSVRMDRDRAVEQGGEVAGYWQTTEWLNGLLAMVKPVMDRIDEEVVLFAEDPLTVPIAKLMIMAKQINARTIRLKVTRGPDVTAACAIVVVGAEECRRVLSALDEIEDEWDRIDDMKVENDSSALTINANEG